MFDLRWENPTRWDAPIKRKIRVIDYISNIVLAKHSDGRIFCTNAINLQTMDRDGGNVVELWTTHSPSIYSGFTVHQALILPSGTMLLRITKWDGHGYILRSNGTDYTTFTPVLSTWNGEMLFRSWSCNEDGIVLAGEYTTADVNKSVALLKATNDGQNWSSLRVFGGRTGTIPEIFHIHCVQYDSNSGLWWISCGDTDAESKIYSSDGTTLTLIGSGTQYWRAVSFAFDENYVYWGTDGTISGFAHQMRWDKRDNTLLTGIAVPDYIYVTQKLEGFDSPLFLSDGHTRFVSNTIHLSNNGMDWYEGFRWIANPDAVPYPAFNGLVDNEDGRVYAFTTSLLRHDTGEEFNNGTVILDIT